MQHLNWRRHRFWSAVPLFAAILAPSILAQQYEYIGTAPTRLEWNNPNAWNPTGVPASGDTAVINTPDTGPNISDNVGTGSVQISGSASVLFSNGSTLTLFDMTLTGTGLEVLSGDGLLVILSGGTLTSNAALTSFEIPVDNLGDVNAATGTLGLTSGSNEGTLSSGAVNAKIVLYGAFSNTGTIAGTVDMLGGTLTLNAETIINGTLNVGTGPDAGTIDGPGQLTVNGTVNLITPGGPDGLIDVPLVISNSGTLNVTSHKLTITKFIASNGAMTVKNTAILEIAAGASVTINGTFNLTNANVSGAGDLIVFDGGTLNSSNQAGTNLINCASVVNSGIVASLSGILAFAPANGKYTQTAGITRMTGGNLSGTIIITGGILTGNGSITGSVANSGTFIPGNGSAGLVTINGSYTQSVAGQITFLIGGKNARTEFNIVRMSGVGSVNLDGIVNISLVNGFTPATNDVFDVITLNSLTGSFATVNDNSSGLAPDYKSDRLSLATLPPNFVPGIDSLVPNSTIVDTVGVLLSVRGVGFANTSRIQFNGTLRPTTIVSSTELTTTLTANDVIAAGSALVRVVTPKPGGGTSTALTFTIRPKPVKPAITSPASAVAIKGVSFTYRITVTGTQPITFSVTGLPVGLSFSGDTISGVPSVVGSSTIGLTATNEGGVTNQNLSLNVIASGTNHPPVFTSAPTANPSPAQTGQMVTFTAVASDIDEDAITYTWDFGDSTTAAGSTVTHTYNTLGIYDVTVTISDSVVTDIRTLSVLVGASGGENVDVQKLALKFTFNKPLADTLSFSGVLPVTGLNPAGKTLTVKIANFTSNFTLDAKGKGASATGSVKLSGKLSGGVFTTSTAKFTIAFKKLALFDAIKDLGFKNENVAKGATPVATPIIVIVDGKTYIDTVQVAYTAKANVSGTGKMVPGP